MYCGLHFLSYEGKSICRCGSYKNCRIHGQKTNWKNEDVANENDYQSDYDLVIFCNWDENYTVYGVRHFFREIPQQIQRCLERELGDETTVELTGICIQFELNGYEFDLTPAINFSNNVEEQKIKTYEMMAEMFNPSGSLHSKLSGGLCETGLNFFKYTNPFIHKLVILCKCWYNYAIPISSTFPGSKLLIETVAVHSGLMILNWVQENAGAGVHQRMYYAFRDFLRCIKSFKTLNISNTISSYSEDDIPDEIRYTPLVMDPVNPYNNLAEKANECKMEVFSECAEYTLSRLSAIGKVLSNGQNIPWRSIFSRNYEDEMYDDDGTTSEESSTTDGGYY